MVKKHSELSKEFYFTNNTLLKNKLKVIHQIHQTHQTKNNILQNVINNLKKNNKKGIYN